MKSENLEKAKQLEKEFYNWQEEPYEYSLSGNAKEVLETKQKAKELLEKTKEGCGKYSNYKQGLFCGGRISNELCYNCKRIIKILEDLTHKV